MEVYILRQTDSFNGTSWTTQSDMATATSNLWGVGIRNAALEFGGYAGGNFI
jgi:hypothetical protein